MSIIKIEEIDVIEVTANKTLHHLRYGWAYYNYKGTHFRIFRSFKDGKEWLKNGDDTLVVFETDNEQELDLFLMKADSLCCACTKNPIQCGSSCLEDKDEVLYCEGFSNRCAQ